MKCSLATVAVALLLGVASSGAIPITVKMDSELSVSGTEPNSDTLIFSHIIYRHGDRTWEDGMQLTNNGKMQMYKAGQFFRKRYGDFLGGKYGPNKVYIISTDTDRAIMSAQANLAGFFPPTTDEEKWNDKIFWQPISVHTIPHDQDTLLHGGKSCPKYDILYKYYMEKSPEAIELMEKYADEIAYWSEMSERRLRTIEDVTNLYKRLMDEKDHSDPLPDWAKEAIKENGPMEIITRATYKLRGTPELVRRRSGFLIKDILERSARKLDSTLRPDLSLYMYSAHSATLATMLNGLGIFELNIPPYGSSLHFELYKTAENGHYLQFIYRRYGDENPVASDVPGVGEKWTLDQFYSARGDLIPGDFDAECDNSTVDS